jgi:hypothetical protein
VKEGRKAHQDQRKEDKEVRERKTHLEFPNNLGRHRAVVLRLRVLDLLLKLGESFRTVLRNVRIDERLRVLLDLLGEVSGGLADEREGRSVDEEPTR